MSDERDEGKMPPIPDGGLSESMPDWLRRPPAWRTLKDAEVVQPEPAHTTELPEADTSVIDPRTFLTDDDLPEWLRKMGPGRRHVNPGEPGHDEPTASTETGSDSISSGSTMSVDASREDRAPSARSSARFVPRTPTMPISTPASSRREAIQRAPSAGSGRIEEASTPWWRGTPIVLLLALLLLIAIGVIVVLVGG